jgi:hypothetical protein
MSDAVNDLQRRGDQSDLAGLGPEDLYVMRYLRITDDPELLDKLLEVDDHRPVLIYGLMGYISRDPTPAANGIRVSWSE